MFSTWTKRNKRCCIKKLEGRCFSNTYPILHKLKMGRRNLMFVKNGVYFVKMFFDRWNSETNEYSKKARPTQLTGTVKLPVVFSNYIAEKDSGYTSRNLCFRKKLCLIFNAVRNSVDTHLCPNCHYHPKGHPQIRST